MIEFKPEQQIALALRPGAVFYFIEESFETGVPHFFILINHTPLEDPLLFLVCSSSQIDKVKERYKNSPDTTLVEIEKDEYDEFTEDSIINCNVVFKQTRVGLVEKLRSGKLKIKNPVSEDILERLRLAVCDSPEVLKGIKKYLIEGM